MKLHYLLVNTMLFAPLVARDQAAESKLVAAIIGHDVEYVREYLEEGGDINFRTGDRQETPLMIALQRLTVERFWPFFVGFTVTSLLFLVQVSFMDGKKEPYHFPKNFILSMIAGLTCAGSGVLCGALFTKISYRKALEGIIDLIINEPSFNPNITNVDGQTALDILRINLSGYSPSYIVTGWENSLMRKMLDHRLTEEVPVS